MKHVPPAQPMRVLSLGAGVQSSTLALMMATGEAEPVQCAVFADTGDEPRAVYAWLDWLEKQLPFPVYRVTAGQLSAESTKLRTSRRSGNTYLAPGLPVFVVGADGKKGMFPRQCTREHKIDPINRLLRKLAKVPRGPSGVYVEVCIGISLDEVIRMKPSKHLWARHIWPLVDARMTRADCLRWMATHGYPQPPRSACIFCPYHSDREWIRLREESPEEFEAAVAFEKNLQTAFSEATAISGTPYLHASRRPLAEVTFDAGAQPDLFGNECEGMCGV